MPPYGAALWGPTHMVQVGSIPASLTLLMAYIVLRGLGCGPGPLEVAHPPL